MAAQTVAWGADAAPVKDRPDDRDVSRLAETAEEYAEKPFHETGDGRYVEGVLDALQWVLGFGDAPELPEPAWCQECGGKGGWAWETEGPGGHPVEHERECGACDGTGVVA